MRIANHPVFDRPDDSVPRARVAEPLAPEVTLRSELEIVEVVRAACERGGKVRVTGARGSKNDCYETRGTSVRLEGFDRVLRVHGREVTVEAGITLRDLADELDRRGLALPTPGEWGGATLAGALSTGTHGGSARHGILSTSVRLLRLVTGTGERLRLDRADPRFAHAALSLGALGVITEVTLACEPHFQLWMTTCSMSFEEYLAGAAEVNLGHEFSSAIWSPPSGRVVTYVADRVEAPPFVLRRPRRYSPLSFVASLADRRLGVDLFRQRWFSNDFVDSWSNILVPISDNPHRSPVLGRVTRGWWEVEFAVSLSETAPVLRDLEELLRRPDARLSNVVGLRPTAGDDFTLSPCRGRPVLWIALHFQPSASPGFTRSLRRFIEEHDGRCHWGKSPALAADGVRRTVPGWESFARVRRDLDPRGVFLNPFLERLL